MSRPAAWAAVVIAAVLIFGGAIALTVLGLGNAPTKPQATPTEPEVAQVSSTGPPESGAPGSTFPEVTPPPQPTPLSTDKVGPRHSVGPKQLTGYGWPLHRPWITSRFGPRDFGTFIVIDGVGIHDGLDLATHCGDTVRAAHDGTVLVADRTFNDYLGYLGDPEKIYERTVREGRPDALAIAVVIDDGNGYRSQYMHLKEATVQAGQYVHRGDKIGVEGETGAATGCHVHYSLIRMDGPWQLILPRLTKYGYPPYIREHIDPMDVLPWGDADAPLRLYNQVHPPSPSASPTTGPSGSPTQTPNGSPTPAPTPTPTPSPSPTPTP